MGGIKSDTKMKSKNAFVFPAVDRSNQRYQIVVKDYNDQALACRQKDDVRCAIKNYNKALRIDPGLSNAYRRLSRLLASESMHQNGSNLNNALEFEQQHPQNSQDD